MRLAGSDWLYAAASLLGVKVREARRAIGGINPIFFGRVYFPELFPLKTPDFHWSIIEKTINCNRYAVAATVGIGKTVITTKLTPSWEIFYRNKSEILSVSLSNEMASSWLDEMRARLSACDELREDFGDFIGQHWGSSEAEYSVPNAGPGGKPHRGLVRARGRGCAIRGMRPDHILLDDPQDEDCVKSDKMIEDFREWFWGGLITRLDTDQKLLTVIATAFDDKAFICELINNPPPGWTTDCFSILNDEGKSIWPEKYSDSYLAMRRAEMGELRFFADYMNAPIRRSGGLKFAKGVKTGAERSIDKHSLVTLCLDPSFAIGGDNYGFTLVEQLPSRTWHVHEAYKNNNGTEAMLDKLFEMTDAYPQIDSIGIELGGSDQSALTFLIADREKARGRKLPIMWLKHGPNRSKEQRIDMLVPLINTGRLEISAGLYDLRRAIVDYRAGMKNQEDALLDSLAMHLEVQTAKRPTVLVSVTEEDRIRNRFRAMMDANKRMRPARPPEDRLARYEPGWRGTGNA
jgi:hypothetical protein